MRSATSDDYNCSDMKPDTAMTDQNDTGAGSAVETTAENQYANEDFSMIENDDPETHAQTMSSAREQSFSGRTPSTAISNSPQSCEAAGYAQRYPPMDHSQSPQRSLPVRRIAKHHKTLKSTDRDAALLERPRIEIKDGEPSQHHHALVARLQDELHDQLAKPEVALGDEDQVDDGHTSRV
ncbi:hypothetical protein AC578_2838 [Pseudocercospora eumusae]|uniref:Uncharacterized protein n=1 Tax=Pseudocercospora eumusae TaxID=321146 RepID=A0A139H483_9PEZI|nr:hypothetical protein AC578_2838 [Pseudocercospora eumusae]